MDRSLKIYRIWSRWSLAMFTVAVYGAVLLSLIFESHRLALLPDAAWTIFGMGLTGLTAGTYIVFRGIYQNPSDRSKETEEE